MSLSLLASIEIFHKSCDLNNGVLFLLDFEAGNIRSGALMAGFQGTLSEVLDGYPAAVYSYGRKMARLLWVPLTGL